jgi:hypothetical protein
MPETWFCESCSSLNRGQADRCYRCKAPRTAAVVVSRAQRPSDMLVPGVDALERGREAAGMAEHAYISPALLGFVSVVGFTVMFAAGLATLASAVALAVEAIAPDVVQVGDGVHRLLLVCLVVLNAGILVAFPCHSVFLWLTTRNVPALAGGTPLYGPERALLWWVEAYLWRLLAYCIIWILPIILLLVVLFVVALGLEVLGFVGMVIAIVALRKAGNLAGVRLDFPLHAIDTLRKPARLLNDLAERLAMKGASAGRLVSLWQTSWIASSMILFLMPFLVLGMALLILALPLVGALAGIEIGRLPSRDEMERTLIAFELLMLAVAALTELFAILFMARLTLALTDAQRERRKWLVQGESLQANILSPQPVQPAQPAPEPPRAWNPAPVPQPAPQPAQPAPQPPAPPMPAVRPVPPVAPPATPPPPPAMAPRPALPQPRSIIGVVREEAPREPAPPQPPVTEPKPGDRPTSRPDIPPER